MSYNRQSDESSYSGSYSGSIDDVIAHAQTVDEVVDNSANYNNTQQEAPQEVIEAQEVRDEIPQSDPALAQEYQDSVIADYHGYQTDPDNYQGRFTKDESEQAYNYLSRNNNYSADSEWSAPNPELDLFTTTIPNWIAAKAVQEKADADYQKPLDEDTVFVQSVAEANKQNNTKAQQAIYDAQNMKSGNWELADESTKAAYTLVPGSRAEDDEDVPWYTKVLQPIMSSIMAGAGGAGAGALIGAGIGAGIGALAAGVGAAPGAAVGAAVGKWIGGLLTAGATYYSQYTGKETPINKPLEWLDAASVETEKKQGQIGSAWAVANRNLEGQDAGLSDLLKEAYKVYKENPDLGEVSGLSYEVGADFGVSELGRNVINAGAEGINNLFGTDIDIQQEGEVSRANTLQNGLFQTEEGTRGYASLYDTYMPVYQQIRDACIQNGMPEDEAKQYAYGMLEQMVTKYQGTTGMLTDLGASTVADPMNLLDFGVGKATEGIGKVTGDTSLVTASKASQGNPIADALNIDAPKLGLRQSQGINTTVKIWGELLKTKPVDQMNWLQKTVAGVGSDGKLAGIDATTSQTNWFKRMVTETNESKMYNLSNMNVDMVGSVLMDGSVASDMVPRLIDEITTGNIAPDSPLKQYENSAVLNTLQENYSMATPEEINTLKSEASRFSAYEPNRRIMNDVIAQTGIKADDLMEMLGNPNGQRKLLDTLNKKNIQYVDPDTGVVSSPAEVYQAIEVFSPERHGQVYYSDARLKADVMNTLSDISDRYMLQKYGISQDKWTTRLSNLTKSLQSIELLNYSPSYLVNNFLNNMITRTAQGVGGIDSLSTQNLNARRGLSYARDSKAYDNTKRNISHQKNASRDLLSFAEDGWKKLQDGTISGSLIKGFSGLADIEGMETKAAFDIGAERFWNSSWKNGVGFNIPEADMLKAGFSQADIKYINDCLLGSANLDEFKKSIYSTNVQTPNARAVFADMLKGELSPNDAIVVQDFMSLNPQIMDVLDEALKTQNPTTIQNANTQARDMIASGMNSYMLSQLAGNLESVKTKLAAEGYVGFFDEMKKIDDLRREVWVGQTIENNEFFNDIASGRLANVDPDTRYKAITDRQTADYNIVSGYYTQLIAGATETFGMDSKTSSDLIRNVMEQFDIHNEFLQTEHALYQEAKANDWSNYGSYKKKKNGLLAESLNKSLLCEEKFYGILTQHLRDNLAPGYTNMINKYEALTKEIIADESKFNKRQVKEANQRADASGRDHKIQLATKQEANRIAGKESISDKRLRADQIFQTLQGGIPVPAPTSKNLQGLDANARQKAVLDTNAGWSDTLRAEYNYELAKSVTKQAGDHIHNANPNEKKRKTAKIDLSNDDFSAPNSTFKELADSKLNPMLDYEKNTYGAALTAYGPAEQQIYTDYQKAYSDAYSEKSKAVKAANSELTSRLKAEDIRYKDEVKQANRDYQQALKDVDAICDHDIIEAQKKRDDRVNTAQADYQKAVYGASPADRVAVEKKVRKKRNAAIKRAAVEEKARKKRDAAIKRADDWLNGKKTKIEVSRKDKKSKVKPVDTAALDAKHNAEIAKHNTWFTGKETKANDAFNKSVKKSADAAKKAHDALDLTVAFDPSTLPSAVIENERASFASGKTAVPLGFISAEDIKKRVTAMQKSSFELLDSGVDVNINDQGFPIIAACYPFDVQTHTDGIQSKPVTDTVRAGVYVDGKLIAYLTDNVPESIQAGNKTVPVIGLSADDPNNLVVFVNNQPRTIVPGEPQGIDYSPYKQANYHPMRVGTTPDIEPWGDAALVSSPALRQVMEKFEQYQMDALSQQQNNAGGFWGRLKDNQRKLLVEWADNDVRAAFSNQRYSTQRYAETMVDASLLNYNKRYGFDNSFSMLMPYQFWMTRSVMEWGKRMIDKPQWFSMYARIEKLIEKNKKDFLPTRLEGLIGIPMPNLPDGLGSALYIDPMGTVFPFQQFFNMTEYYEKDLHTIHKNTIRRIEEMYDNDEITDEEYDEAMEGRGDIYQSIFAEERENDEADTGLSGLIGSFISPNILVDTALKAARGEDDKLSITPMTRMGNLIKSAGDNTAAEFITNMVGNAMQLPEKARRSAFGLDFNPEGTYADYYINSYIANMLYTGDISYNQAVNAIAEGDGNAVYDQAKYLYGQTRAYGTQWGALATEIGQRIAGNKETSVQDMAGATVASLFGAKAYPEGEQLYRQDQSLLSEAKEMGDDAKSEFYRQNPEYSVRNYSYEDDPETRLHKILVDNCTKAYYSLPQIQREAVGQAFGPEFIYKFVKSDTRCTDYIDDEKLIAWTQGMMGNTPNISAKNQNKAAEAVKVDWYTQSTEGLYQRYQEQRNKKFPGIKTVEDGYYALPTNQRKQYLKDNSDLQQYWDWEKSVKRANPKLAAYLNERSAYRSAYVYGNYDDFTQAILGDVNDWTRQQAENYIQYGWAIPNDAKVALQIAYKNTGGNGQSFDDWLASFIGTK